MGHLSLFQGIFPTQGSNPGLPPCRRILYRLRHKGSPRILKLHTIALISHASKVKLNILQPRLSQYVNCEIPDVQAGFRKARGTRNQIANIHWIIENAREFQKNTYFCFIDYAKAFCCVDNNKLWKILQEMGLTRLPYLLPEKSVCRIRRNS